MTHTDQSPMSRPTLPAHRRQTTFHPFIFSKNQLTSSLSSARSCRRIYACTEGARYLSPGSLLSGSRTEVAKATSMHGKHGAPPKRTCHVSAARDYAHPIPKYRDRQPNGTSHITCATPPHNELLPIPISPTPPTPSPPSPRAYSWPVSAPRTKNTIARRPSAVPPQLLAGMRRAGGCILKWGSGGHRLDGELLDLRVARHLKQRRLDTEQGRGEEGRSEGGAARKRAPAPC